MTEEVQNISVLTTDDLPLKPVPFMFFPFFHYFLLSTPHCMELGYTLPFQPLHTSNQLSLPLNHISYSSTMHSHYSYHPTSSSHMLSQEAQAISIRPIDLHTSILDSCAYFHANISDIISCHRGRTTPFAMFHGIFF